MGNLSYGLENKVVVVTGASRGIGLEIARLLIEQKTIPLGRIAEPADVAHPALFLCSAAADFITGQTLTVDGGATVVAL